MEELSPAQSCPHTEAENRKAKGAGTELSQGHPPPPFTLAQGSSPAQQTGFDPTVLRGLHSPGCCYPSTGKLACRGELGLSSRLVPQGSVLLTQKVLWLSWAGLQPRQPL